MQEDDRRNYEQDREIVDMKVNIARHEVQIKNLESNLEAQNNILTNIQNELKHLVEGLGNRPSWLVTWLMGSLLTAVGTLSMYILTAAN